MISALNTATADDLMHRIVQRYADAFYAKAERTLQEAMVADPFGIARNTRAGDLHRAVGAGVGAAR